MTDSQTLLAEYVRNGSEPAFRELLRRYIDLVHSTAVRVVGGDTHLAEDVAQTVFTDLARRAASLPSGVMIGGWLHRHTCFVARKSLRSERRRQQREREVVEMNAQQDHWEANLAAVAPILDEAIEELEDEDRTAILFLFFEQLDYQSVGEALGSTDEAARKRVSRALEKLQVILKRRGVETFPMSKVNDALEHLRAGKARYRVELAESSSNDGQQYLRCRILRGDPGEEQVGNHINTHRCRWTNAGGNRQPHGCGARRGNERFASV